MRGGSVVTHRLPGAGLASDPGVGDSQSAFWSPGKGCPLPPPHHPGSLACMAVHQDSGLCSLSGGLPLCSFAPGSLPVGVELGETMAGDCPQLLGFIHIAGATQCHLASLFLIPDERFYKGWKRSGQSTVSSRTAPVLKGNVSRRRSRKCSGAVGCGGLPGGGAP